MTAFILPQPSNGHSLDKVEHRARLPPSQNESSELRFRRSSLADQLLCDGTHLSLVYGASCRRKAKGLSVAPLSTFYRKYRRLPPLLGHFSDRSGRRTRPKPMTNEVSPAPGRLLAAFTRSRPAHGDQGFCIIGHFKLPFTRNSAACCSQPIGNAERVRIRSVPMGQTSDRKHHVVQIPLNTTTQKGISPGSVLRESRGSSFLRIASRTGLFGSGTILPSTMFSNRSSLGGSNPASSNILAT